MNKVTIIGSCICRDLFKDAKKDEFSFYTDIRFTSPISIAQKQIININLNDFIGNAKYYNSEWFRRIVRDDISKIAFETVKEKHGEWCIIDLADARIPLGKVGESYFTYSLPFNLHYDASLKETKLKGIEYSIINPRNIPEKVWKEALDIYATELLKIFDAQHIILIENYCSKYYVDNDGVLRDYSLSDHRDMICTSDILFKKMYSYFASILKCKTIKVPDNAVGSEKNKWGIHPLHMDDAYYTYLLMCIKSIIYNSEDDLLLLYDTFSQIFCEKYQLAFYKKCLIEKQNVDSISTLGVNCYKTISCETKYNLLLASFIIKSFINKYDNIRLYHYGINNLYIKQFYEEQQILVETMWLSPKSQADWNGLLVIDDYRINNKLSEKEVIDFISHLKEKQHVIIFDRLLASKFSHIEGINNIEFSIGQSVVYLVTKDAMEFNEETIFLVDTGEIIDVHIKLK